MTHNKPVGDPRVRAFYELFGGTLCRCDSDKCAGCLASEVRWECANDLVRHGYTPADEAVRAVGDRSVD